MTTDIHWSVKKDINCWTCGHFQRFDKTETPETCAGECRRRAPRGDLEHDYDLSNFWPLIIPAPVYWCSNWERTLEKPLPPFPEESGSSWSWCTKIFDFPEDYWDWVPWNRKLEDNVSCWHCDHFQRTYENASQVAPSKACHGECRKNPPLPVVSLRLSEQCNDDLLGYSKSLSGPLYWCGEFEKARHEVPPTPTDNGEICGQNINLRTIYELDTKSETKDKTSTQKKPPEQKS